MITAWWFNSASPKGSILQPDFFVPKTHFRIDARLAEADMPMQISIDAYLHGELAFRKAYSINNVDDLPGFKVRRHETISAITLKDFADSLAKNPERLDVTIKTARTTHTSAIDCEYVTVSGRIMDFDGNPFPAMVAFNRDTFEAIEDGLGTWSDMNGNYTVTVPKGDYNSIIATDNTIWKSSLENWCWKMMLDRDEVHDFKIGNGEVYSLEAWTDNGGIPNLFVFFRPMVLPALKADNYDVGNSAKNGDYNVEINGTNFPVMDIAPDLELRHVTATMNGRSLKNISMQKIFETSSDENPSMPAYILQTERFAESASIIDKQTLVVEYDTGKFKSQGRTQFFYTNSSGLALR